jgi:transcription antitermination factor NusG
MENVARMAGACLVPSVGQSAGMPANEGPAEAPIVHPVAWFALIVHQYKREQCEQMLASRGYEYFSPCFQTVKTWSDRRKRVDVPLFPGYIFCRFDPEKRLAVLQIPGVLGIVSTRKQFLEVDAKEIEAIRTAMASRFSVEPYPFMMPGQKVKVAKGPLCGVEGVLVRVKDGSRLLLSVGILNRCVSVEVNADQLAIQDKVTQYREVL